MPDAYQRYRTRQAKSKAPKKLSQGHIVLICAGGGLLVAAMLAVLLYSGEPPKTTDATTSSAATPEESRQQPRRGRSGSLDPGLEAAPLPTGPRSLADLMNQPDDGGQTTGSAGSGPAAATAVADSLAAARLAMAGRDLRAAQDHLDAARAAARTPAEQADVKRAERLLDSVEEFWKAVRQAAADLPVPKEIQVGDTYVMVVDSQPGGLTVRADGKTRVYLFEELPASLAIVLFERALGSQSVVAHLHMGSFLAVDREGDRDQARAHWQQAGQTGAILMPELDR
jgi:hypothetical protein